MNSTTKAYELYYHTGRITTELMIAYSLHRASPLTFTFCMLSLDLEEIKAAIDKFEQSVYIDSGLQKYIKNTDKRGHRCKHLEQIDVLMYIIAGRVLITFTDLTSGSRITLITAQTPDPEYVIRIGIQSINATKDEVLKFLYGAIRVAEVGKLIFEPFLDAHIVPF